MSHETETPSEKFLIDAENKAFDLKHRQTIRFNMSKYQAAVKGGMEQYQNHELARARGSYYKGMAVENLDTYLLEWESKFTKRGGKVIWARNSQEALKEIVKIFERKRARLVVKSKSMTTEEIHLNEYLEKNGITSVETDLGEWIVQMAGQRPYHIVTPAMHMSKKDISDLFVEKLKIEPTDDPEVLVAVARKMMREKYTTADIGITGANFIVADVGGIAVTENEGNARLTITFPKTHIVVAGIEKVIPEMAMLDTMWPLLATSGTGQQVTCYNTIISGPRQPDELDGPEEMYVVLLDNGRSKLLADPEKREALKCIRCGACLNACPVYKNIGGHAYDTTYSGPIGSVLSPQYNGLAKYKHLSFASSLCGACSSVCPVKIDIANLLLLNRKQSVDEDMPKPAERLGFQLWKMAMKMRWINDVAPGALKSYAVNMLFSESWGKHRSPIQMPPKTFHDLWKKRRKG